MADRIYLSPPDIGAEEKAAVLAALDSGWVTTLGPAVEAFERETADFVGVSHAVALSSGTAALHLALLGVGVSRGDEVLVSTLTFAATANAVVYCGATPVFIDSDRATWNMDPDLLEAELREMRRAGRRAAAVIAVDLFGHCADYDAITDICRRYEVPLVEDAAESLGATWNGRPAGSFGEAAVLSFNGNKIMTTSGGGMLLTDDERLARRARHLATQAREPMLHYEHLEVGYNYRLSNILAALGSVQLRRLPQLVTRRRDVRRQYIEALTDVPGVSVQPESPASSGNAWLTAALLPKGGPESVIRGLAQDDVEARPVWKPMHRQPAFAAARSRTTGVADELFATGVCLPSGSTLTDMDVSRVLRAVLKALDPA